MESFSSHRGPFLAVAALGISGVAALVGLAWPLAGEVFGPRTISGEALISKSSAPLVRIRFAPPRTARLTLLRDGKPQILVLYFDPGCPPPSGWA
jgi:hypothetical protein